MDCNVYAHVTQLRTGMRQNGRSLSVSPSGHLQAEPTAKRQREQSISRCEEAEPEVRRCCHPAIAQSVCTVWTEGRYIWGAVQK